MRAAYLGALARAIRWVRGALTHGLPGARGHRLLARNPPERSHGSGAGVRLQLGRAYAPPHCPLTRRAGAAASMHTASGRSRQLRAHRPLSAEAFGHGPSRARGNAVGCRQHRLRGQLRCEGTNEPVHSNIFPLRY